MNGSRSVLLLSPSANPMSASALQQNLISPRSFNHERRTVVRSKVLSGCWAIWISQKRRSRERSREAWNEATGREVSYCTTGIPLPSGRLISYKQAC